MTTLSSIRLTSIEDAGAGGVQVYATPSLLPTTGMTAGDQAFVTSNQRLYISTGSGWYNVALINSTPTFTTGPDATYALATDLTPTVITLLAQDSDGQVVTYSASDSGMTGIATLSQDSSVFTITPLTDSAGGDIGTFTITFQATDGIGIASALSTFTLSFGPDWSVTPTETILRSSDIQAGDTFGNGTSINDAGDYIAVSARYEDGGAGDPLSNAGAVYVFNKSGGTWSEQQKLTASDATAGDGLGGNGTEESVPLMISGDGLYIIAGADAANSGSGVVYIFARSGSTWTQQQKISPPSGYGTNDRFGTTVALNYDGTYAAIAAPRFDNDGSVFQGIVRIYTRSGSTWSDTTTNLQPSDVVAAYRPRFGSGGLQFNEDATYLAVAAHGRTASGLSDAGAVYVFTRSGSTWSEQAIIVSSDIQASDKFGASIGLTPDANYLIVGATFEDGGAGDPLTSSGAAYVFTRSGSTWTEQAKLTASDAQADDWFGNKVAISNDGKYAVVKAGREDGPNDAISNSGALYVFERDGSTWTEIRKIRASDAQADDQLGHSIDISGDGSIIAAGTQFEDGGVGDPLASSGALYVYEAG